MKPPFILVPRKGVRPRTTPTNPHEQLDDNSPAEFQEALWDRMAQLPGVATGHSHIAPKGSRALRLVQGGSLAAFMVGREFAHMHPSYDGSLHLTLDVMAHAEALNKGWAEPHPLAGRFAPATTVMIYGPRNEEELEVVWAIVQRSLLFARGGIDVP